MLEIKVGRSGTTLDGEYRVAYTSINIALNIAIGIGIGIGIGTWGIQDTLVYDHDFDFDSDFDKDTSGTLKFS